MNKKINETDFVIFDVETTGLNPRAGDRIIEIAALRFRGTRSLETFSSLVNPQTTISQGAFEVNHITQEMVDNAPLASKVIPDFLNFLGKDYCFAGYNVGFDLGFLENEVKLLGKDLAEDTAAVDVLRMARSLIPNKDRYGLGAVASYLGVILPQEHRALKDVELTTEVFSRLLVKLEEKRIDNFLEFYNLFGFNLKVTEDINSQRIFAIQKAIDLGLSLNIRYCSTSAIEITERKVTPKEIRQLGKYKYMVGYCHLRKDERTFKINAILDLEVV